jgi:hypothetical protein
MQKVYLIEDCGNSPGRIYAVMADEDDALSMGDAIEAAKQTQCRVVERTVYYGQLPNRGYCE